MVEISRINLFRKELHFVLPLTIGLLVYAIARPISPLPEVLNHLLPFQIPNAISTYLTSWLPDFLWAYAFGGFLAFLRPERPLVGLLLPVGIGVLHEFGQGFAVFSGIFDPQDIFAYLLAGITIYTIHFQKLSSFYLFSYEKFDT